jgi:starch phosphorylase
MPGTRFPLEVTPRIPARIGRLSELANNLWYSWDRPTRALFSRLHPGLWRAVGHSPKAFLKRVDQKRLDEAAEDPVFIGAYNRVLSEFDNYLAEINFNGNDKDALIAYFCFEFGFHESLPIYSGGLGILAGDHCKAASDLRLPFVGVGLLYREGYFLQTIDRDGHQQVYYNDSDFDDLPITPVMRHDGTELHVPVEILERQIWVRVWQAEVGHVRLYLLDTDIERNSPHDRDIAHRLYGGDRTTRIEQEIVLGVGGVRALADLGLKPTTWHINEGHAAFLILERINNLVAQGIDYASALEAVAASTVFTTHTAVPAGHDQFQTDMAQRYFERCFPRLQSHFGDIMALGRMPGSEEFNMTALAIHGSRFHNGVSRIHGGVSADMLNRLWPEIQAFENPLDSITNGVHVPTFLATDWHELFDRYVGEGWTQRLTDVDCWKGVMNIPDLLFWSTRQSLKSQMLHLVRNRVATQHGRNQGSEAHLDRLLRWADPANPNVLTIGFARRFATYKRAALLFSDLNWLRLILSNPEQPVLFIFAGKAHPADRPGQEIIRRIADVARMPEFEGRILLAEGYDLHLARRLVSGVDVWLNNPVYPLEASGTSGMKAAINGVINLSVLDGWWDEGYDGSNGWAIKPASDVLSESDRDREEARTLYEILQDQLIPLYYKHGPLGYSPGWVATAKRSIASIMPIFNTTRMVREYQNKFYSAASRQWRRYSANEFASARRLAEWKGRVRAAWPGVVLRRMDSSPKRISYGDSLRFEVAINLNGLAPEDVTVEILFGRPGNGKVPTKLQNLPLLFQERSLAHEHVFALDLRPELCGRMEYRIRAYPNHDLLTHAFEMGMMRWL